MEKKNAEFIKIGKTIMPKPKGADYDLIPGQTYDLKWDDWEGAPKFSENGELNLPKKVYELEEDVKFKTRVLNNFNKSSKSLGVMLAGEKGTGKTMLAKIIAKESNLPIIVVDSSYPAGRLNTFFKEFSTPVCVIFDEVEKNFNTNAMLDFLDGVEKTTKKLVLMTCNELNQVSEYIQDRCSRIRYVRKYTAKDNLAFLPIMIEEKGIKNKEEVENFVKDRFMLPSIDNMNSFLDEIIDFGNEGVDLEEVIKYMNINTFAKGTQMVEDRENDKDDEDDENDGEYIIEL